MRKAIEIVLWVAIVTYSSILWGTAVAGFVVLALLMIGFLVGDMMVTILGEDDDGEDV